MLYAQHNEQGDLTEFAIDLCRDSQPSQIIVACIPLRNTLAEMVASLERKIASAPKDQQGHGIHETMLIPNIAWRISHHFRELEDKLVAAPQNLAGSPILLAQQDTEFRLDRGGMKLRSESRIFCASALATVMENWDFRVDRPFLLCIRKRGAQQPYFVMWIDNAELLQKWTEPAAR